MKVIAIIGAAGGVGATTVAAHLAASLTLQKKPVISFDFCPDNVLRLHFGMEWKDESGFARSLLDGQPWHEAAYRSERGVDFVPFGQLRDEAELDRLCAMLSERPAWLVERLQEVLLPRDTVVFCDCPRTSSALRAEVLGVADLVLIVATPDPLSYAAATRMAHAAASAGGPPSVIVLNTFDSARGIDRDIAALLRIGFQALLAPVVIHRDEFLREALACKQSVFEYAPSSQAAFDFPALASWVLTRVNSVREAA